MPRYVLTGAPGSGKTALLRQLEFAGHPVVEESATAVIDRLQALGIEEPWRDPDFTDRIVTLQRHRQLRAPDGTVFFDRSPICTLALARHLSVPASSLLLAEVERVRSAGVYDQAVFFVRNQGHVRPTPARRIGFEESLAFEKVHEATYRELGFELVEVPPAPLEVRAAVILRTVGSRPEG